MSLITELQVRETALLHENWRGREAELDRMLAHDFVEIAANGRVTGREAVLAWLLQKDPQARWRFADWQLDMLAPQVVLLRYRAQQSEPVPSSGQGAWHSSLWSYGQKSACWQLRFHQASRIQ